MAKNNKNEPGIKNADTRARRDWVESALEKVRSHLDVSTVLPSTVESLGHEPAKAQHPQRRAEDKPQLYLACSEGQRRPGI
jgi:hypothetical protein